MAGNAENMKHMLKWCIEWFNTKKINDDQVMVCSYANQFPNRVKIDYENNIFLNDAWGKQFDINTVRNINPCFYHAPGIKWTFMRNNYNIIGKETCGYYFLKPAMSARLRKIICWSCLAIFIIIVAIILVAIIVCKSKSCMSR